MTINLSRHKREHSQSGSSFFSVLSKLNALIGKPRKKSHDKAKPDRRVALGGKSLHHLSDHQLKDIGLRRDKIGPADRLFTDSTMVRFYGLDQSTQMISSQPRYTIHPLNADD